MDWSRQGDADGGDTSHAPPMRKRSTFVGKNTLLSKALGTLASGAARSHGMGMNSKRRKMPLMFIPPSTNSPLFVYNNNEDQRSFLSLGSRIGSESQSVIDDNESVSTSRSLPSTLSGSVEPDEMTWLIEEQERRYSREQFDFGRRRGSQETQDMIDALDRRRRVSSLSSSHMDKSRGRLGSFVGDDDEDFANEVTTLRSESTTLLKYCVPLIITFFLEQAFSVVCVMTVGHLGAKELAAVSLASMTSTIVLAIFEGISTALDTLCPQAYGAGNYYAVGIHCQRCTLFSLVLFIPAATFWYFSGYVLQYLIEDKEVIRLTQLFLRILIIAGPPYICFENGKRYLQAQGIFDAGTIILFITAPLNVVLNYLLVWNETIGLGYIGAPIASCINFWLMAILLWLYVIFVDGEECWGGLSKQALYHWIDLSKLAIPGVIMLEAESLAYEILTLFASYLGTVALASQSAVSSVVSLVYMIPFAVSIASSTRLANFVGSGNVNSAKLAARVGLYASFISACLNCLVLFLGGPLIARMFTSDEEVITQIEKLCPLVALFEIFDGMATAASGLLRALGLQGIGGVVNLVGYYVIAVPLALVFTFKTGLGIYGLWVGNGIGLLFIGITEMYYFYTADWEEVLESARKRNDYEAV
ncbi:unnamed protein product [Kuraishia capsulata CBS 1993]|uniref:MATE efflux family protein n=1 Tax=Kuraishia capsulata CBS 1993 TaxID=1382522 RepID=W6MJ41_9ASCO|nr:uncharacterized protein KUCA_T00002476001 [Kuraishia capsulata CBS 1993]CDK26504.1 unnamed protein product [Kuraishia capsulata CBS 1993]